jgi:hypothetical protein
MTQKIMANKIDTRNLIENLQMVFFACDVMCCAVKSEDEMKKMMRYRKIPNTPTTPISKISLF